MAYSCLAGRLPRGGLARTAHPPSRSEPLRAYGADTLLLPIKHAQGAQESTRACGVV